MTPVSIHQHIEEVTMLDDDTLEFISEINQSIRSMSEKISQIHSILTSTDRKRSNIAFDDTKEDGQDDLIDRFQQVLDDLDLNVDLSKASDKNDVKNRASYYFQNQGKISSPRAYLQKVIGQIEFRSKEPEKSQRSEIDQTLNPEYAEELLFRFNALTDEQIEQIRFDNQSVAWAINGMQRDRYTKFAKILIMGIAIRKGIISCETLKG
jgi:hypothetical protein